MPRGSDSKLESEERNKKHSSTAVPQTGIWEDERFQHLVSDPRFRSLPKKERKVKIDKRFQGMFTDEKFHVKYTVDKYGRRVNKSNAEDLRKYYELETSSDSDEDEQEAECRKEELAISREVDAAEKEKSGDENDALNIDGESVPKTLKERLLDPNIDYARGEGRLLTDSSSDDESFSEGEDDPELYIEHVWGELDGAADTTEKTTNRLAVCNMDWDRIRAADLMVLLSSFLPLGGSVLSVKIYPSQYGKERLAEEEVTGPQELVKSGQEDKYKRGIASDSDSENDLVKEQDSDAEEGDEYHMEKLRQYQLNRLRYYYAVVECDSVETAEKIYGDCDGIEYESSATRVDLRFIPNDTTFDEDEPTDVCTELPDINRYKPRVFTTTALQQAKVDLTWDETALERRELGDKLSNSKLNDISDKDLKKIVAFSSEDEGGDDEGTENKSNVAISTMPQSTKQNYNGKGKEDVISKYKALLAEINEKEKKQQDNKFDMELSWDIMKSKEEKADKDLDCAQKTKTQMTPIERVLLKRSEKNKKRKEERKNKKLLANGIDPEQLNSDGDSDSIPEDIDINDPYFAEEFANGDFEAVKEKKKSKKNKQKKTQMNNESDEEREREVKELELLLDDDYFDKSDKGKQHFSLAKIQKAEQETKSKRKRKKQLRKPKSAIGEERKEIVDNFQLNLNDERFKAIYTSHNFNIDPTDPHYKKTKGMENIIQEKLKRRHGNEQSGFVQGESNDNVAVGKRPKRQIENALLVSSLKRKIQMKQQK